MNPKSTCNECIEQIKSFMCDYNEAIIWYSPWTLSDYTYNLSTSTYNKYMRIYPGMKSLGDTDTGIELTKCPSTTICGGLISDKVFTDNGLFCRFEIPRIKYVNFKKSYEPGYECMGRINYLVIEKLPAKTPEPKENLFV